ncbi:MAG: hypothetical protein EOP55_04830 [Sphingobacteriales bacterium]|nr:MAG: hypothetical protein EOP55_04830 [Sphingobacteriales bacterium]
MIKFHYVYEDTSQQLGLGVCVLLQQEPEGPFLILDGDEILGQLDFVNGCWCNSSNKENDDDFMKSVSRFINEQQFLKLPLHIKKRWPFMIEEVIVKSESSYLIVTKAGVNFSSFERIFKGFISEIVKDEWAVVFKVFNAEFDDEFVFEVKS